MPSQEEIEKLAYKNQNHTISSEEKVVLEEWYKSHDDQFFFHSDPEHYIKIRIWNKIRPGIQVKMQISLWIKVLSAACLLLVIGLGLYLLKDRPSNNLMFTGRVKDVEPGGSKAVLTLSNGTKIDLDQADSGNVAVQGSTNIIKQSKGKIDYRTSAGLGASFAKTNNIETPPGGQYQVVLSDGSKVWLNSKSSLHFPVNFKGNKQRIVQLKGEAYFEISKDPSHPFIVESKGQQVLVLGTHFNVNTYEDEAAVTTTLTEGSIQLSGKSATVKLKPNQQSINDGSGFKIRSVDTSQFISWKDGYFEFENTDLKTAMRQIARWYNLKVVYTGELPSKRFSGKFYRNLKLSSTLKILNYFGVKFLVTEDTIYIN